MGERVGTGPARRRGGPPKRRLGPELMDEPARRHARPVRTPLSTEQTVAEAIASLRGADLGDRIVYFYVLDPQDRLAGIVPARQLLTAGPEQRLEDVMQRDVVALPSTATVFMACEFFVLYRYLALPVVDEERRLLGVIDVSLFTDELADAAERRSHEDTFQLIGVHVAHGRRLPARIAFRDRFPWLTCNIVGGLACALLASRYEGLLGSAVVLALFIPVVLALAESVSIQSLSLTLQSLHSRRLDGRRFLASLRRELVVATLLGTASGGVLGAAAWTWRGDSRAALAIGLSVLAAMVTASLLGVLLPTAVHAMRRDPKVAAGPMVLAIADLATLLFYFSLAGWLLA